MCPRNDYVPPESVKFISQHHRANRCDSVEVGPSGIVQSSVQTSSFGLPRASVDKNNRDGQMNFVSLENSENLENHENHKKPQNTENFESSDDDYVFAPISDSMVNNCENSTAMQIPPIHLNAIRCSSMSTPKLATIDKNEEPTSAFPELCSKSKHWGSQNTDFNTPIISKNCKRMTPRTPNYISHRERADKLGKLPIPVMSGKPGGRKHAFHGEGTIHFDLLEDLILKKHPYENLNFKIIDCRYPYEFAAGHIKGAQNIYLEEQAIQELFENPEITNIQTPENAKNTSSQISSFNTLRPRLDHTILIFHCEFSSLRAPKMGNFVRNYDRKIHDYPELSFPTCVVLDRGFREFYNVKKDDSPYLFGKIGYIEQMDKKFVKEEKMYHQAVKKSKTKGKQRLNMAGKVPKIKQLRSMSQKMSQNMGHNLANKMKAKVASKMVSTTPKKPSNKMTNMESRKKRVLMAKTPEIRKTQNRVVKRRTIAKAQIDDKNLAPKGKRKRTKS